jgi:hypothetical protein
VRLRNGERNSLRNMVKFPLRKGYMGLDTEYSALYEGERSADVLLPACHGFSCLSSGENLSGRATMDLRRNNFVRARSVSDG